jgi:hypothetical protein
MMKRALASPKVLGGMFEMDPKGSKVKVRLSFLVCVGASMHAPASKVALSCRCCLQLDGKVAAWQKILKRIHPGEELIDATEGLSSHFVCSELVPVVHKYDLRIVFSDCLKLSDKVYYCISCSSCPSGVIEAHPADWINAALKTGVSALRGKDPLQTLELQLDTIPALCSFCTGPALVQGCNTSIAQGSPRQGPSQQSLQFYAESSEAEGFVPMVSRWQQGLFHEGGGHGLVHTAIPDVQCVTAAEFSYQMNPLCWQG